MPVELMDAERKEIVIARFVYRDDEGKQTTGRVVRTVTATSKGASPAEYGFDFDVPTDKDFARDTITQVSIGLARMEIAGKIPRVR